MKKTFFNLKNKNIIITGGNGFLGSQITDALLKEQANVFIIDIKKSINLPNNLSLDVIKLRLNSCLELV